MTNPFITDILEQPAAVRRAVERFDTPALAGTRASGFERVVITGMGSSLHAGYTAWLTLARAGVPAWHIDAGELLHQASELINKRTLLIMISQSGRSAEILELLDKVVPGRLICITNDTSSPLAECSQAVVQMHAGDEATVSTKTYTTTLAVAQLAARQLTGQSLDAPRAELIQATDTMAHYLEGWRDRVAQLSSAVGVPQRFVLVGRGPSLAAVHTAALILKEGAKVQAEGLGAGQFRHGPLELTDERLTALVLAGEGKTRPLNERLASELRGYGAKAHTVGTSGTGGVADIVCPTAHGAGLPVVEIIPLQLLVVALAETTGIVPGQFRYSGKVTTTQ